jgi:hypothetical protein
MSQATDLVAVVTCEAGISNSGNDDFLAAFESQ